MITKRALLTGAASVAALAATTSWRSVVSAESAAASVTPFDAIVFNDRYADARAFAQSFAAQGTQTLPIGGDAGTLWYGTLRKRIAAGQTRLAGIGTYMDFFIFETLARDVDLKARFRGQHDCRGRRTLTHSLFSGECAPQVARAVELAGAEWPAGLAAALPRVGNSASRSYGVGSPPSLKAAAIVATSVERSHDHPGLLVSWVLDSRVHSDRVPA